MSKSTGIRLERRRWLSALELAVDLGDGAFAVPGQLEDMGTGVEVGGVDTPTTKTT